MEAILLTGGMPAFARRGPVHGHSATYSGKMDNFFMIVTYVALLLSASATISAVFLTDKLGAMQLARKEAPSLPLSRRRHILQHSGLENTHYSSIECHCE